MTEHTKEPWDLRQFAGDHSRTTIEQKRNSLTEPHNPIASIAELYHSNAPTGLANGHRIVACVNACAGVPTEKLENLTAKKIGRLQKVNRQLAEALRMAKHAFEDKWAIDWNVLDEALAAASEGCLRHDLEYQTCGVNMGGNATCKVCGDCYCLPPWTMQKIMKTEICKGPALDEDKEMEDEDEIDDDPFPAMAHDGTDLRDFGDR